MEEAGPPAHCQPGGMHHTGRAGSAELWWLELNKLKTTASIIYTLWHAARVGPRA